MATLARLMLELNTNLAAFQQDMGRAAAIAERTAKRIDGVMKGVGGSLAAIGAGLAFKSIIDEAGEAEQALKQLQQTIKSTGGVAGVTVDSVTQISGEIQKLTGVSDDAVNSMASVLLTFTKVGKQVFPEATKAIVDMSAKLGTDLKSSAVMVGKALNDPVKGMTALSKAGVSFSQGQKDTIKALVESGNTLKAQQMILRELQTEFGGAAAAARNTLKGAFDALGVAAKDVLENIGSAQGTGLRGALEFMVIACEKAAAYGRELSLALQGIAVAATAVVAVKTASELAGLAKMILTVTAAGGGWVAGLGLLAGALVAFRDEQATLIGSTKTWGQLTVEAFNGIAMIAKPVINGIIDSFVQFGQWCASTAKMVVDVLGGAFKVVFQALGQQDLFDKVTKNTALFMSTLPGALKAFSETANKQSAAAGKDYVGNFFNPILNLANEAKKRMDDIGKAAERGAKLKINVDEGGPAGESKAEKKAREKAETAAAAAAKRAKEQHEQDQKSVEGLLGAMKQQNDELTLRLAKEKEMIPELEAQNKLAKLGHLTEKERAAALGEINKLAAQRRELEKQVAIKDEGEKLQQVLENYKQRTVEIQNAGNKQNELNVSLRAQAEIDKIIKVGKGEHLELVNQILAAAKEQEAVLREQKRLESLEKYGNTVQELVDQNRQMELKVRGQEEYLPLLEQEKKIREVMKDQNLSDQDKSNLVGQIQEQAQQTVRYNQALDQQDRALKAIKDSSGSTAQKIAALQAAYASGTINVKQYQESLADLRKEGFDKVKKDAKDFSDILTSGLEKALKNGASLKDVFKEMRNELILMASRKIIAPLAEGLFSKIAGGLFGKQYGINQGNPALPPQFGGGTLAGGGAGSAFGSVPTTLAEGPAIVSLLQQILVALGGTPGVTRTDLGGLGFPYGPPTTTNFNQSGGGLFSRLRNMFGGGGSPLSNMLAGSGLSGGLPSSGGGMFGALGGVGHMVSNGALGLLRAIGTPFFAQGGFLGAGQWGIAGERGPELIYGGQSGMSIIPGMNMGTMGFQAPWQQQNVYSGGRGGYSGNGMISQFDYANTMGDLLMQKYESGVRAFQNGDPNAPSWYTLQEILAQANRYKTTVANNGYTGQLFSRAQFEMSSASADFNEAAYQWGGNRANVQDFIYNRGVMSGYNPNARMNSMSFGLASSGMGQGSSAGIDTGSFLPPGLREASYTIGNGYQPIISTGAGGLITQYQSNGMGGLIGSAVNGMQSAFSRMFGGPSTGGGVVKEWNQGIGPVRSWSDAVARFTGGGSFTPNTTTSFQTGDRSMNWRELKPGEVVRADGSIYRPGDANEDYRAETGNLTGWNRYKWNSSYSRGPYDSSDTPPARGRIHAPWDMSDIMSSWDTNGLDARRMIDAMNRQMSKMPPAAMSFGGNILPAALADMNLPPQVEQVLGNLMRGHQLLDSANPTNFLPSNMLKNAALSAAGGFAMNPMTWKGDGDYSGWYGSAAKMGWFNRSMSPMDFGAAAKLFGGRAMRHGGLPHRGEPLVVGEAGAELFVPSTSGGRILPSTAFDGGGNGGIGNVYINTKTVAPVKVTTKRTSRGLEAMVEDAFDAAFQRSGVARDRFQQEYDVRRRPIPRS